MNFYVLLVPDVYHDKFAVSFENFVYNIKYANESTYFYRNQ